MFHPTSKLKIIYRGKVAAKSFIDLCSLPFSRRGPYVYSPRRYARTFLENNTVRPEYVSDTTAPAPLTVYCFWTGDNELTPNRKRSLAEMERMLEVPVELITPQTLPRYIKPGFPLHPAYEYLSLVHRSDYLRCYFMHHHGGGYSDIKRPLGSWRSAFERLNSDSSRWLAGYPEIGANGVPNMPGRIGKDVKRNWSLLTGNGAYICKPLSPLTYEWHSEQNRRLDKYLEALKAAPGNILGDNPGYPIAWSEILAQIFHPVCLKYHERVMFSPDLLVEFTDYR